MLDDLLAALKALETRWETRSDEARSASHRLRVGDTHRSYYFRGVADGYKAARDDLRRLLTPEPEPEMDYAPVSLEMVRTVFKLVGVSFADLFEHGDNTFTATFMPLQLRSFDEVIGQLSDTAEIVVLSYGRLPDGSKSYLDFGFKTPPGDFG
jgi:hypothetical protein